MNTLKTINDYLHSYRVEGRLVREVLQNCLDLSNSFDDKNIWITKADATFLEPYFLRLEQCDPSSLPLYGVPFAVKDNIDVAGLPTTAGCAEFSYIPTEHAFVVEQLINAGAIPIGKTNMDQFASGLVGTRSPYGEGINLFDPQYISGGSSSGSALAVTAALVPFSLGTDTAGSGRVPASFGNIVGLKPTRGALSIRGVVPACKSLDCVAIFAQNCDDAQRVYDVCSSYDAEDSYSRPKSCVNTFGGTFRFGVPRSNQLEFFGNSAYEALFWESVEKLELLGGLRQEIDFTSFMETAKLLYHGPWIAERYCGIKEFAMTQSDAMLEVTRGIVLSGFKPTAMDAFEGFYRLSELKRKSEEIMGQIDLLLTPTAGTIYTRDEVRNNPLALNTNLGYYTNFMNLLDLSACAVPAGFTPEGLPFGVTLAASSWNEPSLLGVGAKMQSISRYKSGLIEPSAPETVVLAVCGAHMSVLPLNHELTSRGAVLIEKSFTAPLYRFYALESFMPPRPGLVQVNEEGGSIAVELWKIPIEQFGSFFNGVPSPLALGSLTLIDGKIVKGFLCENYAVEGAKEITQLGGWRNYLLGNSL
ncbi:MAG: allophanate hydrolase [Sulfuricurvum sp.]|jgi:allophanate hydrolase|uniref:allophanate hydrolase n=1 Tax=Sulfuricurvum sp. TaxID=2025608 RepID=UPI0025CFBB7A|nr:allophanate hydrolase [Sulfuricurvum sp.]MCK9374483.1 allophanate hydrolase [Sulfuricurvum sp.]